MKKTAFFSDLLFCFFSCFLFSVCLFRYWHLPLFLSFLLAGICGGLITASITALKLNKKKNLYLKKSDEENKEKLLLHLALLCDDKVSELFQSVLHTQSVLRKTGKLRLSDEKHIYFLHFRLSPVNADDIAKYARIKTLKGKILLCSKIEENAQRLCDNWGIEVKTEEEVYLLFKQENKLPEKFLGECIPGKKKKGRLQVWFCKRNGKTFLACGAMLLFSSFMTPFPYYYLLFGGIMLLTSAVVRIFGHE